MSGIIQAFPGANILLENVRFMASQYLVPACRWALEDVLSQSTNFFSALVLHVKGTSLSSARESVGTKTTVLQVVINLTDSKPFWSVVIRFADHLQHYVQDHARIPGNRMVILKFFISDGPKWHRQSSRLPRVPVFEHVEQEFKSIEATDPDSEYITLAISTQREVDPAIFPPGKSRIFHLCISDEVPKAPTDPGVPDPSPCDEVPKATKDPDVPELFSLRRSPRCSRQSS